MKQDNRQYIIKCWFDEITNLLNENNVDKAKEISSSASEYVEQHFNDLMYWPSGEA